MATDDAVAGGYDRDTGYITTRVTRAGGDGYTPDPGRYRLVVSRACPWANRALIVRRLLGLEPVISLAVAGPLHDTRSWNFDDEPGGIDHVLGISHLAEAYEKRFPGYDRGVTVPALVEIDTVQVVTNDIVTLTLDLATEWVDHHRPGAPDLYPDAMRDEIDSLNELVYHDVNNGVYQTPGFGDTIDFGATKTHYYGVHRFLNPTGIVPVGPDGSDWTSHHDRDELGGRPFGGGTPPGPPPDGE
ncbi:MAG: hypothetical protein ACFCVK_05595 [Acidimicrobiales bacterium]